MCVRMYRWFFLLLISSSSSYLLFRLFGTQYFGVIQLCKHKHDGELNKSLQHIRTIIPCTARALPLSSNSELYTQATHKRTWQTFVVRLSDTAGNNTRNSREYSPETCAARMIESHFDGNLRCSLFVWYVVSENPASFILCLCEPHIVAAKTKNYYRLSITSTERDLHDSLAALAPPSKASI